MQKALFDIIRKHTRFPDLVSNQARLVDDLGLDSYGFMLAICEIEDEFDVSIHSDTMPNLARVEDLLSLLTERQALPQVQECG